MPETPGTVPAEPEVVEKPSSLWSDAWSDLRRNPIFIVSLVMITLLVLIAAWPSLFSSINAYDFNEIDQGRALEGPSPDHWFGFDTQGVDVYAGVIYATRTSVMIGVVAVLLTAFAGGLLGLLAGFFGGWFDMLLGRVADIFFAFPIILAGLLVLTILGDGNMWLVMVVLAIVFWPMTFRIMRAAVLTAKSQDYVLAAKGLGASNGRLMFRHVLPNAIAPVIVVATTNLGVFIAAEAALSYLGVGIQPPNLSWGLMISDGQQRFWEASHPIIFPAIFLCFAVLSFVLLGDAVRDALDPKLR